MKKKVLSLSLILCMFLSFAPVQVLAASDGISITTTASTAGADYPGKYGSQWYKDRDKIVSVTIADGVTTIPDYAFDGCSNPYIPAFCQEAETFMLFKLLQFLNEPTPVIVTLFGISRVVMLEHPSNAY